MLYLINPSPTLLELDLFLDRSFKSIKTLSYDIQTKIVEPSWIIIYWEKIPKNTNLGLFLTKAEILKKLELYYLPLSKEGSMEHFAGTLSLKDNLTRIFTKKGLKWHCPREHLSLFKKVTCLGKSSLVPQLITLSRKK